MFFSGFGFTAILQLDNNAALIALLALAVFAWWLARKHERHCTEEGCEVVGDDAVEEYGEARYSG